MSKYENTWKGRKNLHEDGKSNAIASIVKHLKRMGENELNTAFVRFKDEDNKTIDTSVGNVLYHVRERDPFENFDIALTKRMKSLQPSEIDKILKGEYEWIIYMWYTGKWHWVLIHCKTLLKNYNLRTCPSFDVNGTTMGFINLGIIAQKDAIVYATKKIRKELESRGHTYWKLV